MSKGPDAFRTISEVAEDLDIPQHVLRFWETRFTSIRPLKRGGGRRYYRPDDVDLLRGIRQLLYGQGYTIKGVQRILKEDGLRFVQGIGRGETAPAPESPHPAEEDEDLSSAQATASLRGEDDEWTGETGPEAVLPPPHWPAGPRRHPHGLSAHDRDLLRAALDELLECERALETLKRS